MMLKRLSWLLVAVVALFAQSSPALAWGPAGHRAVARIAMANVSTKTAARLRMLLRDDRGLGTPKCRVRSLGDAAVWPDCLRGDGERWGYTFAWHYQDEPVCGSFDIKSDCANGNCVTAQIARTRKLLADRTLPAAQRLEALAFLVHFVGDLHQPLHEADHDDHGGNLVAITNQPPVPAWEGGPIRPITLHWFWDKTIAERALAQDPKLVRTYAPAERAGIATGDVADWARESWDLARARVYPGVFGKLPCGQPGKADMTISEAELAAEVPLARQRLLQAGLRLAKVLDEALGG